MTMIKFSVEMKRVMETGTVLLLVLVLVGFVAICAIEPGQDASWFEDAIVAGVLDDLGDRMGVRFEAPRPVVLEDQPCLLRSGRSPQGGSIHCYVFSRGRRLIGLFTWDEDGSGPPQSELRKCFESD